MRDYYLRQIKNQVKHPKLSTPRENSTISLLLFYGNIHSIRRDLNCASHMLPKPHKAFPVCIVSLVFGPSTVI